MRELSLGRSRALRGVLCMCLAGGPVLAQLTATVTPPQQAGDPVRIRAEAPSASEWVMFFYRPEGSDEFQSIMLRREAEQAFSGELEAAALPAGKVDCYLAAKSPGGISYLPEEAPGSFRSFDMPERRASGPQGGEEPATYRFPVHVEGALERVLHHQEAVDGERRFTASGQLGLGLERETPEDRLVFDARVAHTNQPYGTQDRTYLAGLQAEYRRGSHQLRAGDLTIQESEFTVAGAGRRGSDYTFDNQRAYVHAFAVNTQQLEGLDGAAWPHADTRLYGGALGYRFLDGQWRWKAVFVDGKDDPFQSLNGGFVGVSKVREGSTVALVQEASLLGERLNLSGEYARSRIDPDLSDGQGEMTGQAWRVGGTYTQGIFTGSAAYHSIGKNFDTLGQTGFVADRVGADAAASWGFRSATLNLTALDEEAHASDGATARNQAQAVDLRWILGRPVSLRFGLSHGRQTSGSGTDPQIPFSDSTRKGGLVGVDIFLSRKGTLTATYQVDRLESSAGSTGRSGTATVSGVFTPGPRFRFAPSLNWSRIESQPDDQVTRVAGAFLTTDITFIPDALLLSMAGGCSRTTQPSGQRLTTTTADASLQFLLGRYLPKGTCILGLRGRYSRQDDEGQPPQTDNSIALTLNVSM